MSAADARKPSSARPAARSRIEGGRLRHRHRDALASAAKRLRDRPLAHAMALLLLAIGLLAAALIGVAAERFSRLATPMAGVHSLSLFLAPHVDDAQAQALAAELRNDVRVAAVERISPDEGLAELALVDGTGRALEALSDNPLPWVLAVEPADRAAGASIADAWRQRPEVDHVADEGEWLARADAALAAARTLAIVLAALVLAALVVVAANAIRTIRIEGAPERALQRVFGATEADLRRPYLYLGALYGLIAGALATLAAAGVLLLVQPALAAIAQLLDQPAGPGAAGWMPLLAMAPVAALLGWVGAWFGCLYEPDLEASE